MTSPDDMDFCYSCNAESVWNGERCTGCGRFWGYEHGVMPCD